MTPHPPHPRRPSRKEVERALSSLDFPLDKDELVRRVAEQDDEAGTAVLRQLEALPLATYGSAHEVLQSVEVADQLGP